MAAKSYYNQQPYTIHDHDQQHLLSPSMSSPGLSSGHPSPLKPLQLLSHDQSPAYHHAPDFNDYENLKETSYEDAALKARIRRLRVVSRLLSFLISVAVLVPITMTLVKFLSTQNTHRDVKLPTGNTVNRTAWAKDTKVWPTWMYFAVAAVSVLLNFGTVFSYKFGVDKANVASYVASTFSWTIMIGNFVVWSVAAGIYRNEKDKNGKSNDLWGWTCSAAARAIQKEFAGEVDFDQYCNVQSISFYIGCVQAGAALLTTIIYIMVFFRRRSKRKLARQLRANGFEPARH